MSTGPAVRIAERNKRYGAFHALEDVDLTVARGETIVVRAPSGSGTSTMIRRIDRLEEHEGGTVTVPGTALNDDVADNDGIRREVGMVSQHVNLLPHVTVLENCVPAPLRVRKVPRGNAEATARRTLEKVRIPEQASEYPGQLSGGRRQRVAVARALCMQPPVMPFDGPTSALGPETANEVLVVMVGLAAEGRTTICVTREMGFARRVADRIVFMDRGEIVEAAAPEAFLTVPTSGRTRRFPSQVP